MNKNTKTVSTKINLNQNKLYSRLFVLGLITIFSLFCVQSIAAEQKGKKKKWGGRAAPVAVTQAVEQYLSPTIQVPGTVVSRQQSELPSEVSGKLVWVADVGTKLKWGDPVAKLDDTLYRLEAAENKASLTRERARFKYLNKEFKRLEELIKGDFSSRNALDKVQLDRDIARSEINVAKARVKVDEETLARYLVRTPFEGIVVERSKREGEWVSSGATLVTFANPNKLEIQARVSEKSIVHLKKGYKVRVLADGRSSVGTVRGIVGIGDPQSHLFEIRIDLSGSNWVAGKAVRVDVPVGKSRRVLAVTRDALVLRRSGVSLYRINADNKSEKISIETGITGGEYIEIIGDINPGDNIVTRGNERLREGQSVKIIKGARTDTNSNTNSKKMGSDSARGDHKQAPGKQMPAKQMQGKQAS